MKFFKSLIFGTSGDDSQSTPVR